MKKCYPFGMRGLFAPILLVLALLLGSVGVRQPSQQPGPAAPGALRSAPLGERDGILQRDASQRAPILGTGRQGKSGHGPAPAPFVLTLGVLLALPQVAPSGSLFRSDTLLTSAFRSAPKARAPPHSLSL